MYFIPGDVKQVRLLIHTVSLKLQQTCKQYSYKGKQFRMTPCDLLFDFHFSQMSI